MTTAQDAEIASRYAAGEGTFDIAQALGVRVAEVIGVVRGLGLQPPGMGVRRAPAPLPTPMPLPPAEAAEAALAAPVPTALRPCSPLPVPAQAERRRPVRAAAPAPVEAAGDDEDEDEQSRRPGCPKGWLVSEAQMEAAFRRAGRRFEDVVFKPRAARPAAPVPPVRRLAA